MNGRLFLVVLAFWVSASAWASNYIILFQQAELSITSLEHDALQQLLQSANQKSVTQLSQWLGTQKIRAASITDLWLIRGAVVDLTAAQAQTLSQQGWIQGVYPDTVRKLISPAANLTVANTLKDLDPTMWGLQRIGLQKIRAEFPQLDGTGIKVGVIDTGIQSMHPELGNPVVFKDFVNNLPLPYDDAGHGTHVSGTIAGKTVGIAPQVSFVFAKAFNAEGAATDSSLLAAMQWMFDPDGDPTTNDYPRIVSNSWGGDLPDQTTNINQFLPYQQAITAWIHGGIIPIFAAGNSGVSPNGFPGGLPDALAVGAIAQDDSVAAFSSRGPNLWLIGESLLTLLKPDVAAPGVGITSAYPGNKYATMDGTSMATPHVTGSVALLLQANPKLNYTDVKNLLIHSAERKADTGYGFGILDAYNLVKMGIGKKK